MSKIEKQNEITSRSPTAQVKMDKMRRKLAGSNERQSGLHLQDARQMNFSASIAMPISAAPLANFNVKGACMVAGSLVAAFYANQYINTHKNSILSQVGIEQVVKIEGPDARLPSDQKGLYWAMAAYAPQALATAFEVSSQTTISKDNALSHLRILWPTLNTTMQSRIEEMRKRAQAPALFENNRRASAVKKEAST